ncbi:MAG: hypothetical protein JSR86_09320 [Proteobacteria bacterium]|nr:hypothetical protein [Pseudomonadota bacterium]
MRVEDVDFAQQANTFWAVFTGAFLATVGGIVTTQTETRIRRRERERDAALMFGEILNTLHVLVRLAGQTRGVGDPYGPITMRMVRACRREIDVYDRNRETLYELRDGRLRVSLHGLIVRITMSVDGVLDASAEIAQVRASLKTPGLSPDDRDETERSLAIMNERRDQGFDFILETGEEIPAIVARLGQIARHTFQPYETGAGVGVVSVATNPGQPPM